MGRYIPVSLQKTTAERANFRCEYCRLPEIAALIKFHFEHIVSLKHGGKTISSNLAMLVRFAILTKVQTLVPSWKMKIRSYVFSTRANMIGLNTLN